MSNYVKSTDFASKDALTSGDPLKLIKGTEINTEFNNIQTAVATKADLASPAFTGNPTATTQATGNSSTRLATTAFVNNQINANQSNVAITGGTIDGVAITGGTLTGLATDLAVADGGTGKSSLALNNVLLGNGTSAIQEVAPSTSGNVLTSNGTTWTSATPAPSLGVNQTWQNLTSSRSVGTSYQNTTSSPIAVSIHGDGGGSMRYFQVSVDNSTWISMGVFQDVEDGNVFSIIPINYYYRVQAGSQIAFWAELR